MSSWEEIVTRFVVRPYDQIKKITKPLHEYFGVKYFTYHKVDKEGNYTVLLDRPDWAEHYVGEKFYLNDPFLRNFSVYESGLHLFDNHRDEQFLEKLWNSAKNVLDCDYSITLVEKNENGAEFFGFTGPKQGSMLPLLSIHHPHVFSFFAKHFKQETASLLQKIDEKNFLPALKGDDFFNPDPITPFSKKTVLKQFLTDLNLQHLPEMAESLSTREKECLNILLDGKTAKQIGYLLGLSPRTIESYLDNIKSKLQCWTKAELVDFAKELKNFHLI